MPRRTRNSPPASSATALWIYSALIAAIAAVFHPLLGFQFVDLDDYAYVLDNIHVSGGLSMEAVRWAFTQSHEGYWAPLTWLSYMLDAQLYGSAAGGFHATNVLWHTASACLLFAALTRMTGARGPSAFVAAVFAIHPLHVESVAWIAERKDVVSTFFYMLALWSYARYVEHPSRGRYLAVAAAFACGLLAKPMVLTLPVVLLLLDVWPLRRRALLEKLPLFALAVLAAVVAVSTQASVGAVVSLQVAPPAMRIANAAISIVIYLWQTVWPVGLAALYPYPRVLPLWPAICAAAGTVAITAGVLAARPRAPYLAVGWFWYLVTLLPVLGFLQAGPQARADRYTYVAMTGIAVMVAWSARAFATPRHPRAMQAISLATLGLLAVVSWNQVSYWKDTETLFRRALAVTEGNYVAHKALGTALIESGRIEEGIGELDAAVALAPDYVDAHAALGYAWLERGNDAEALRHLQHVIQLSGHDPAYARAHLNVGTIAARSGNSAEAEKAFAAYSRLRPDAPEGHMALGSLFAKQGRTSDAIREMSAAVRLKPNDADLRSNLGVVLAAAGRLDEAIEQFSVAVRLNPNRPELRRNLELAKEMRGGR